MSTLAITVAGNLVTIINGSFQITDKIDERSTCSFQVLDTTGTVTFSKNQPVTAIDSTLGTLFTGYVNQPQVQRLHPNTHMLWTVDCIDQTYMLDKRLSQKNYANQFSGTIVADQLTRYGAAEGINGQYALKWDEQQADWQQGTLSGTTATSNASDGNPGDGDLELFPAGSPYTTTNTLGTSADGNVLVMTGYASSGYSNAYTYRQIWAGSLSVTSTNDAFTYDVWVASTSPQIMAGVDFICSDGTTFSASSALDWQGLGASPKVDLSGLANDTWYSRDFLNMPAALVGKTIVSVIVGLTGNNAGSYAAYFRGIQYTQSPSGTTTYFWTSGSNLGTNNQVLNLGYSNVSLTQAPGGEKVQQVTWNIGQAWQCVGIVQSSQIRWSANLPTNAKVLVETSTEGFTYQTATNNASIPNLFPGALAYIAPFLPYLNVRATFTLGSDPTATATLNPVVVTINPAYHASKSDIMTTISSISDFNAGTYTNTHAVNGLGLVGFQENWDTQDNSIFNQTLYGNSGPSQAVVNKQFRLTAGASTDAKSQFNLAGQFQNFTLEVDVTIPSNAAASQGGVFYRTTGFQNANDTYAYAVSVGQNGVAIGRGTNTGSGGGAFTNIQSVSLALAANSVHRLKVVANGNNHQISLDGTLLINATDGTWPNAGYVGLRAYNFTTGTNTVTFDNFGIVNSLTGTWQSPAISLAAAGTYGLSVIAWDTDDIPDNTCSISVQTSINGGGTWTGTANGGYIPGLVAGQSLAGVNVLVKVFLAANNAPVVPTMQALTIWTMGQYASSGTRSTAPIAVDSMKRANVVGSFGTASNGQTWAQTGTGTPALTNNEATITNTSGDVQMILGSGTTTQDTDETVRFALSASTMSAGMELHFSDANHYYRLVATTTVLNIVRNVGGGVTTIATASVTLTPGTFYRMRFRAVSSGLAQHTLYGRVWADGTTEPTTWGVSVADSPYKATVLADNPTHYYRLGDPGPTAADIGGILASGTINGGVTTGQAGLLVGDLDGAMLFDGATGYIALPSAASTNSLTALTVEFWFNLSSTATGNPRVIANSHADFDNDGGFEVAIAGTSSGGFPAGEYGTIGISLGTGSAHGNLSSIAPIKTGLVYHAVFTWDGSTIRYYQNGAFQSSVAFSGTLGIAPSVINIGRDPVYLSDYYAGVIDEVAIYNSVALTSQQIINHYQAGVVSGGVALFANGTGVASYDSYRATSYPDPAISLASVGNATTGLVNWNANTPAGTSMKVETSLDDGTSWLQTTSAGGPIAGISGFNYLRAAWHTGPFAYYRLDETSGTTALDLRNGLNGTYTGGVTLGAAPCALLGPYEVSDIVALLNGTSGWVSLPAAVNGNGFTAISVECWYNLSTAALGTFTNLVIGDSTPHGYQLYFSGTSQLDFSVGNGTSAAIASFATTPVAGQWTHVVGTYDGQNVRLFVNGLLVATTAFAGGAIASTSANAAIGSSISGGSFFPGKLDEVGIYKNYAMSQADVTAHYNAGLNTGPTTIADTFSSNTSTNYNNGSYSSGTAATLTFDTANARLIASGGVHGLLQYAPTPTTLYSTNSNVTADFDQADASGILANAYNDGLSTNFQNLYFLLIWDSAGTTAQNQVQLWKRLGGVLTQLGSTMTINFVRGTYHRFSLDVENGVLTASMDGQQLIQATDSTPLYAGTSGLYLGALLRCYGLYMQQYGPNVASSTLSTRVTLTTTTATATPQVRDMQAFASGATIGQGVLIPQATYAGQFVSANVDDQNTQSGYWWYVTPNKQVIFQSRQATLAPFIFQPTDGQINNFQKTHAADLYRNQQTLTGVQATGSFTDKFVGDGSTRSWTLANALAAPPTITLNGQAASVGIKNVDTGKQFYYEIGSTAIDQDSSLTVLASTDSLVVASTGSFTTSITISNNGQFPGTISIGQMAAIDKSSGIVEASEDVSQQNMNVAAATTYANQLLQKFGVAGRTIQVTTSHIGLAPGQQTTVFLPQMNLVKAIMLIIEVDTTTTFNNGVLQYWYVVTLTEGPNMGSWVKLLASGFTS